jgi:hypothetical protein
MPRKVPRQGRAQHTVAAILEAAARILEEQGLEAANTNAIAARAGISVGSLYQYFGSKDAIIAELARSTEQATADLLDEASQTLGTLPFEGKVRHLIHLAFGLLFARPQLGRILSYHEARMRKDAVFVSAGERMVDTVAQLLAVNRESHGHEDCATAARDVLAIVEGLALSASRRGETDIPQLERRVVLAVLGYLNARVSENPVPPRPNLP